jgi:uncharacterized UPF0160 family protein
MRFLKNFMQIKNNKLVTHSGSFHADDVFAYATLSLVLEKRGEKFEIERTRDEEKIKNADYVFDVGGVYDDKLNRFDHHQTGGGGKRENGIEYSSFGLVWKCFGKEITGSTEVVKRVDERLVQIIDAIDNGINISSSTIAGVVNYGIYDIIAAFHPSYKEIEPNFDAEFIEVSVFAKNLLLKEIEKAKDQEDIRTYIADAIKSNELNSKILILDEYIPRVEIYIELIQYTDILFVVSPGSNKHNMWRVLPMRNDMNSFESRKNLPHTWAGLKGEDLSKITGVADVVFCHRGLFLAVTKTKEAAVKLAELALLN